MILEEAFTSQASISSASEGNRRKLDLALQLIQGLPTFELLQLQDEIDKRTRRDFMTLPPEVSLVVLGFLEADDLLVCGLVSRTWRDLTCDQALWRSLCDLNSISYHTSLPLPTLRQRQAECFLRRSSPRVTMEDEGWDRDEDGDSTARWSAEAGAFLHPWVGSASTARAPPRPHPPPPQPSYPSLYIPTFGSSFSTSRHSSPAALPTLVPQPSVWLQHHHFPPAPPLSTSFIDPTLSLTGNLGDQVHVPNFKHLFLTSRILSLRPSCSKYYPSLQTLSPQAPSPTSIFVTPPPSAYSTMLWGRSWALVAARDRTVRIWDLSIRGEERVVATLASGSGHEGSVLSLWVGQGAGEGGVRVVTAGSDGKVCVWWVDGRTADGPRGRAEDEKVETRLEAAIPAHGDVSVLCVRCDAVRIVSCSKDRSIRTFSAITFEPLLRMVGHRAAVNAVSLVGDRIVSASGDRSIRIWDATTGASLGVLEAHLRGVASIDFDGRFVLSGSSDAQVRMSDVDDPSHPSVTFGPDACSQTGMGRDIVVSGSYDKLVMIWDRKTKALVRELTDGHTQRVFCVAFDQTKIVSVGQDGRLVIHRFDDGLDTSFLKL